MRVIACILIALMAAPAFSQEVVPFARRPQLDWSKVIFMFTAEDDDLSGDSDYDMGPSDCTSGDDTSGAAETVITTTPLPTISTTNCIRGARCLVTPAGTSGVLEFQDTTGAFDPDQPFSMSVFFRLEETITGPDAGSGDPDNGLTVFLWNPANNNMVSLNHSNHFLSPSNCGAQAGFTMSSTGAGDDPRTCYMDTRGVENAAGVACNPDLEQDGCDVGGGGEPACTCDLQANTWYWHHVTHDPTGGAGGIQRRVSTIYTVDGGDYTQVCKSEIETSVGTAIPTNPATRFWIGNYDTDGNPFQKRVDHFIVASTTDFDHFEASRRAAAGPGACP